MSDGLQGALKRQGRADSQHNSATQVVRVAFILLEHFSMTSFSTSMDALCTGSDLARKTLYKATVYSLMGGPVLSDIGMSVASERLQAKRLNHQVIIVVGGHRVRLVADALLSRVLKRADASRTVICGLWNGAFHLAEAGLLDRVPCACHADSSAVIKEYYPNVELVLASHHLAGRVGTCSQADAALPLLIKVMQQFSAEPALPTAEATLRIHQPNLHPYQPEAHQSPPEARFHPTDSARMPKSVTTALSLMEENIEEPLDLDVIARHVRISRRQLERRFAHYLKAAPSRYYLKLRLTRARQLVVYSNRPLTDVALATGFVSYPHFYRRFKEFFGLPPLELREAHEGGGMQVAQRRSWSIA
ncbi:GlxA family transcriptional regulator [Pseudomonas sp. JZ134]|uniref:GlxA family transcriptional regulator n=1 Tax=Pseudomonas sp. JZ134 TaxID=2806615 RepID=UPI003DA08050